MKERGLYDKCWYCENPSKNDEVCGECTPCELHRTALWQLETFKKHTNNLNDSKNLNYDATKKGMCTTRGDR